MHHWTLHLLVVCNCHPDVCLWVVASPLCQCLLAKACLLGALLASVTSRAGTRPQMVSCQHLQMMIALQHMALHWSKFTGTWTEQMLQIWLLCSDWQCSVDGNNLQSFAANIKRCHTTILILPSSTSKPKALCARFSLHSFYKQPAYLQHAVLWAALWGMSFTFVCPVIYVGQCCLHTC